MRRCQADFGRAQTGVDPPEARLDEKRARVAEPGDRFPRRPSRPGGDRPMVAFPAQRAHRASRRSRMQVI